MIDYDKKNKAFQILSAYLIVYFLGAAIISIILGLIIKNFNISMSKSDANSYLNLLTYLVLFVSLIFICYKDLHQDIAKLQEDDVSFLYKVVASYGIFYAINLCISMLSQNIDIYANICGNLLGQRNNLVLVSDNQSVIEEILSSKSAWAMIISAGILGPICEELVFRKSIFDICKTKEMGLIVSSLLFGSIHVVSSLGMYNGLSIILMTIPYVFSGVALGYIYIKNDCNIWVPTTVHIASNVISILGIMLLY